MAEHEGWGLGAPAASPDLGSKPKRCLHRQRGLDDEGVGALPHVLQQDARPAPPQGSVDARKSLARRRNLRQ